MKNAATARSEPRLSQHRRQRLGSILGVAIALQRWIRGLPSRDAIPLANEDPAGALPLIGMANEIDLAGGDGWALIAPYGQWPNERGLQKFGKPEAEQMVGYFKNAWNTIKRVIVGLPIFKGHPDFADRIKEELKQTDDPKKKALLQAKITSLVNQYPDSSTYGSVADLEARDDGLWGKLVITPAGADLIKAGRKFVSPHWLGLANELPDGTPVQCPIFLVSLGLTNRPNIPGKSLVNTAPDGAVDLKQKKKDTTMPEWLMTLLGVKTEDEAKTKVTNLLSRPEPTALANEQTARTAAETKHKEIESKLSEATTALANERTAFAAERKAHAATLVSTAIKAGRITEASREIWLKRLERDFTGEMTALANESGALKTSAVTRDLGARKETSDASDKFTALVNEAMTTQGLTRDAAWAKVKATPQGQDLWKQMEAPTA